MNGYDNNEEMPVDTRSQKILRARLAFSDNYEETEESGREAKSLMTKITLLLLLFFGCSCFVFWRPDNWKLQ